MGKALAGLALAAVLCLKVTAQSPPAQGSPEAAPGAQLPEQSPAPAVAVAGADDSKPLRSLRSILATDLCGRLQIDPDNLELSFNSADDKVLNLVEPYFQFQVTPRRVRTLSPRSKRGRRDRGPVARP